MRKLLIQLVAQNKEQQDQNHQIKATAMILVLEEVLAQQTTMINKLLATKLLWESEFKRKVSAQTSSENLLKRPREWSNSSVQEPKRTVWSKSRCLSVPVV